jgi:hypothetical protein
VLTAELLAATCAHAQDARTTEPPSVSSTINDDTESDIGKTRVDSAVLFYQEAGGRVQAIEPMVGVTFNGRSSDVLSLRLSADTQTGATPNGTTPWKEEQAFVKGDSATGASDVVTAAPHALPIDKGFKDQRYAGELGYSFLADTETRLSVGGAYSHETDYESYSGSLGIARDFNAKNTTASLAVNLERDRSRPFQGTPNPLTPIDGIAVNLGDDRKTVLSVVAGVTQIVSRAWLVQLNYSYGHAAGYQTDPYRLISMVDRTTGGPVQYLYEGRPRARTRHSLYFGGKGAVGRTVLDLSARGYKDSWGIRSITLQAADRLPMTERLYLEPMVRYYRQSAADFFRYYLLQGEALPEFASSDVRLGKFGAVTLGLKLGLKVGRADELYLRGEYYRQYGDKRPVGAPGDLARETLFSGVSATSIMAGYSFVFD